MEILNFKVNFIGVKKKQDIIKKLVSVFCLPNSAEWNWNWDSFEDYFTNLDSDSEIIRNTDPKPKQINLIIKNIKDVKKVSEKDYNILLSILHSATKISNRGDSFKFTFEIDND